MELEILPLEERTDIDRNGRFYRYKKARFKVGGAEHTIRISMKDFDAGKSRQIINDEAQKVSAVLEGTKSPPGKR